MLKAVLFDLDDTLVIADNDALMHDYMEQLATRFAHKVEPKKFQHQLIHSTLESIAQEKCESSFLDRFTVHFFTHLGIDTDMAPFEDFYVNEYADLGRWAHPAQGARTAVQSAQELGLKLVVATNPVFPRVAIEKRLEWAGLADISWDLVTTGEEMHYCKPHPAYFRETANRLGVPPTDCLMVGNDPENDLPAALAGMKTFLFTGEQAQNGEAMRAFSGTASVGEVSAITPDYQGALTELPALFRKLVSH